MPALVPNGQQGQKDLCSLRYRQDVLWGLWRCHDVGVECPFAWFGFDRVDIFIAFQGIEAEMVGLDAHHFACNH